MKQNKFLFSQKITVLLFLINSKNYSELLHRRPTYCALRAKTHHTDMSVSITVPELHCRTTGPATLNKILRCPTKSPTSAPMRRLQLYEQLYGIHRSIDVCLSVTITVALFCLAGIGGQAKFCLLSSSCPLSTCSP